MRRSVALIAGCTAALSLSGCVAALIPMGAAALAGKSQIDRKNAPAEPSEAQRAASAAALPDNTVITVTSLSSLPTPGGPAEGATLSSPALQPTIAAYDGLTRHIFAAADIRAKGESVRSVVLMPATTRAAPDFTQCGNLPLAMIVDLGSARPEYIAGRDPQLVEAIAVAAMAGIAVHYVSDRKASEAPALAIALDLADLGPAKHGENLWLAGDRNSNGKDSLRWKLASTNCIVAIVGDRPGDFSELYAGTTDITEGDALANLNNNGWFLAAGLPDAGIPAAPDTSR